MKDKKYSKEDIAKYVNMKSPMRSIELKHKAKMIREDDNYLDDVKEMKSKVYDLVGQENDNFEELESKAYDDSPEGKEAKSQKARKEMLKMISDRYKGMK